MPDEKCLNGVSRNLPISANSTTSSKVSAISLFDIPCRPETSWMFSRALSSGSKPPVIAISGATPSRTVTVPSSGSSTPAIRLSSVDLPAPLRPTTPIASPA